MSSNTAFPRKAAIASAVLIVLAVTVLPRFMPGATHEAQGTITYVDPAERMVSVEVIDPANGTTREFSGVVTTDCVITINTKPATFTELRVGDTAQVRARIEHNARGTDGNREKRLTAERIEVTRVEGETR